MKWRERGGKQCDNLLFVFLLNASSSIFFSSSILFLFFIPSLTTAPCTTTKVENVYFGNLEFFALYCGWVGMCRYVSFVSSSYSNILSFSPWFSHTTQQPFPFQYVLFNYIFHFAWLSEQGKVVSTILNYLVSYPFFP